MIEDDANDGPSDEDLELEPLYLYDLEDNLLNAVLENSNIDLMQQNKSFKPLTMLISCSVHTLLLCIEDTHKLTSARKYISKVRKVI